MRGQDKCVLSQGLLVGILLSPSVEQSLHNVFLGQVGSTSSEPAVHNAGFLLLLNLHAATIDNREGEGIGNTHTC